MSVPSVYFPMVVVEQSVAVLHVSVRGFVFDCFVLRLGLLMVATLIFNNFVAGEELDDHPDNEHGPEDMQRLKHEHQPVEEVVPREGPIQGHRVHPRRVNDPEGQDDEASDDEHYRKHSKDEITGPPPACVVEHFR